MRHRHVLEEFEETAVLGTRAVRKFLSESEDATKNGGYSKARIGVGAMASYARLRATVANEQALRLMQLREGQYPPKAIGPPPMAPRKKQKELLA